MWLFGPEEGRAGTCVNAEQTAARLLSRGDEELARTLAEAAAHPEDRSTLLWLLIRGFHLMSHQRQCELVLHALRGFAAFPPEEQAETFLAVAPRIRIARRGWQKAKPRKVFRSSKSDVAGSDDAVAAAIAQKAEDAAVPPLVGTRGRKEADAATVEMLDALEIALRRLKKNERRRLYRRLDKGISEGLTPTVFARMLGKFPEEEVRALEAWLVEEGGMSEAGARQLFNALMKATAAKDAVMGVGESLAGGADAVWAGLAEEFSNGDDHSGLIDWLRGRHASSALNSPRESAAGDSQTASTEHTSGSPPRLKVVTKAALAARRLASEAKEKKEQSAEEKQAKKEKKDAKKAKQDAEGSDHGELEGPPEDEPPLEAMPGGYPEGGEARYPAGEASLFDLGVIEDVEAGYPGDAEASCIKDEARQSDEQCNQSTPALPKRRASCQLHCPAASFFGVPAKPQHVVKTEAAASGRRKSVGELFGL